MESRIIKLDAFAVVGKRQHFSMVNGKNLVGIPEMWSVATEKGGLLDHLIAINDGNIEGVMGISDTSKTTKEQQSFDYWIAVNSSLTADLTNLSIPAATWLCFEIDGSTPQLIQESYKHIFNVELKKHGVESVLPFDIEYYSPEYVDDATKNIEIWIPIEIG